MSKTPEQVREEVKPFYLDRRVFLYGSCDNEKIDKLTEDTAENIRSGLEVSAHTLVGCYIETINIRSFFLTSNTVENLVTLN